MEYFTQINDIINSIFDTSRIIERKNLDSGSFGDVFRCRDKQTNQRLAMKILKKEHLKDNGILFFCREVFSQIYGAHPAVVPIIGWNVVDDMNKPNLVIITKFMRKGTLSGYLNKLNAREQSLDPTNATIIMYGIARAMKHLHALKIIHRDLKPSNVFVDNKLFPYIADLGLAKLLGDDEINQSQQCGTLIYVAPEIFEGHEYHFPIDVYSYACIVYALIEMHEPIFKLRIRKGNDIYRILKGGGHPLLKRATKTQEDFLNKMWCLEPSERLTFSQIVDFLERNDTLWFDGTDPVKFSEYKEHIDKNEKLFNKSSNQNKNEEQTEIETKWLQLLQSSSIDASFVRDVITLAQCDDRKAQELAAILYHSGQIVMKSPLIGSHYAHKSGSKYLQMLTRDTSIPSIPNECEIGEIYESYGEVDEALVHYKKSAENERNPRAMWRWADLLINYDIDCQIEDGVRLLQMAADYGDPCACYDMAKLLIKAKFIDRDYQKAIAYLKVAVDNDHPDAPAMLGYAFSKVNDIESAKYYYNLASEKFADTEAQKALALFV